MAAIGKGGISRFFVWIILGLLIVGLAGFGVSSFGGGVRSVGSVGEIEIGTNDYARALQSRLRAMSQQSGESVSFSQAQAMGLDRQVLGNLIATAALDEAVREAGLSVGDEAVSAQILRIPGFSGIDGSFDRDSYQFALEQNGFTVTQFEESVRTELARNLFQAALVAGVTPGPAFGDAVVRFLSERRSLTVAPLTESILDAPVEPVTEAEVQAFYDENPDMFTLPERKAITYAWLTPEMLSETIEVGDAAIEAAFEERRAEFERPARVITDRLAFADEAAAQAAADAIAAGETSFGALLEDRGLGPDDVDLGIVAASDLGAAADGIFALSEPGVAGPLPSPIGPALFRVNAILPAQTSTLDEVRGTLRTELAQARAEQIVGDEIDALDDLLAGGATLEDLAQESDMQLGSVAWTGAETDGPAGFAAFANAADAVTLDDFPEIAILDGGGIFALRLDEVVAPELQPLDAVRADAAERAAQAKLNAALSARAGALLPELSGTADFADAGLQATQYSEITRRSAPPEVPQAVLDAAFELSPQETRLVDTDDGPVVLRLDAILPPDPDDPQDGSVRQAVTEDAASGMAGDILDQVSRAIQAQEGISTNAAAINAVHAQMP